MFYDPMLQIVRIETSCLSSW